MKVVALGKPYCKMKKALFLGLVFLNACTTSIPDNKNQRAEKLINHFLDSLYKTEGYKKYESIYFSRLYVLKDTRYVKKGIHSPILEFADRYEIYHTYKVTSNRGETSVREYWMEVDTSLTKVWGFFPQMHKD